jgi:hypothetical protein
MVGTRYAIPLRDLAVRSVFEKETRMRDKILGGILLVLTVALVAGPIYHVLAKDEHREEQRAVGVHWLI